MPNFFNFSGSPTQVVVSDVKSSGGANFYFGCWVRIEPANAGTPLCLCNLIATETTLGILNQPFAQLWIQNNKLSACAMNLGEVQQFASVDTNIIADEQWHHVGFYVALVPGNPYPFLTGLRIVFFKDGQPTNETGRAPSAHGANVTKWPEPSREALDRARAIAPSSWEWSLSLGPAMLSNKLSPNPNVQPFSGAMANIVVESGLLTGLTLEGAYPATDLFNYVAGTYRSIPRVDPMTATVIALLPGEMTTPARAFCNLASGTPLQLSAAPPLGYDQETFLDGLSEMALYGPNAPFPGTDTGTDPLSLALAYLVQNATNLNLSQRTLAYLRGTKYADLTFDIDAAIGAPNQGGIFGVPYPGSPNYSSSDFQNAQNQLQTEFLQVGICQKYYNAAFAYLTFLQGQDNDNLTTIGLNISSNEQSASTSGNIGDAVTFLASIMDGVGMPEAGGALDGLMALINLCGSGGPVAGAPAPLGAFQGAFNTLASQVGTAWSNSAAVLGTNMATILCDWGKLSLVDYFNTNNQFNWPISGNALPAGWQAGRQIQFMRQLMTATYQNNYLVSGLTLTPAPASCVNMDIVPGQFQLPPSQSLNGFVRTICTIDTGSMTATSAPSQTTANYLFTTLACPSTEVWYQWWPAATAIVIKPPPFGD